MATSTNLHVVSNSISVNDVEEPPTTPPNATRTKATFSTESINMRRNRGISQFLFQEIIGQKLKCYEKWKLWAILCLIMTLIAIIAVIIATLLAVQHPITNSFKTKTGAMEAENEIITLFVNGSVMENGTDTTDELRRIFNTFDDNNDGYWDIDEFADHLYRATETEATFNEMDLDNDDILSFEEVVFAKSQEPLHLLQSLTSQLVDAYYNYSGALNNSLYYEYSANIMFNAYGTERKKYITRDSYYQSHANVHFVEADGDGNGYIDFDEFSADTIDYPSLFVLKSWYFNRIINASLERSTTNEYDTIPESYASMCPLSLNMNESQSALSSSSEWYIRDSDDMDDQFTITCSYDDDISSSCLWQLLKAEPCIEMKIKQRDAAAVDVFECEKAVYECVGKTTFARCLDSCICFDFEAKMMTYIRRRLALADPTCPTECIDCRKRRRDRRLFDCNGCLTCFAPNNKVLIKREGVIQTVLMEELNAGDYVESKSGEWTKVVWIKSINGEIAHLNIYFEDNASISLTGDHLLYVDVISDEYMRRADEIEIGDVLFVMQNHVFIEKKVIRIEETMQNATFGPVTMDGSIVVSNVLASNFGGSYEWAKRTYRMMAVVRFISQYINEDLAVYITDFNYYLFYNLLQKYDLHHIVYNEYLAPIIVSTNILFPILATVWICKRLSNVFQ